MYKVDGAEERFVFSGFKKCLICRSVHQIVWSNHLDARDFEPFTTVRIQHGRTRDRRSDFQQLDKLELEGVR